MPFINHHDRRDEKYSFFLFFIREKRAQLVGAVDKCGSDESRRRRVAGHVEDYGFERNDTLTRCLLPLLQTTRRTPTRTTRQYFICHFCSVPVPIRGVRNDSPNKPCQPNLTQKRKIFFFKKFSFK